MIILIGVISFFIGKLIHNWFGYEKGRKDPMYWRPAHDNKVIFLIITLSSLFLMILGTILIVYGIIKLIS